MTRFKKDIILILLQSIPKVISWILVVFKPQGTRPLGLYLNLIDHLVKVYKTRGQDSFIEYIKNLRQSLLIFLSEEFPHKKVSGIRVTSKGIPKVLIPLLGIKGSSLAPGNLQLILTILFSTRALSLGRSPDVSTIEAPSSVRFLIGGNRDFRKHLRSFWRDLGYKQRSSVPRGIWWKSYHFTTKAGPNGQAMWSSWNDFCLHDGESWRHLKIVGGPKFTTYVDNLEKSKPFLNHIFPNSGSNLRRLTYFPDKENKVRVVAVGDYWSQTVLKSLHNYLFKVIKKIPQDCTFNQGSFVPKIHSWEEFYSIDLTAATDRFPLWFESMVLKGYLPDYYVESWKYLMTLPFLYKEGGNPSRTVSYTVGNPMGLYSSWNSFALAHHYVIYWCCKELNIPWNEAKYVLLGDDVLIGDRRLAKLYKAVMTDLGVTFSPLKTHESSKLCEFAKRYVYKGDEITPFPISSLRESHKKSYLMVNLLRELAERGWRTEIGIPESIKEYYQLVRKANATYAKKLYYKSVNCDLTLSMVRGDITATTLVKEFCRNYDLPANILDKIINDGGSPEGVLSSLAVEAFAETNPLNKHKNSKSRPLGVMAENIMIMLTGVEDPLLLEHLCNTNHMIPILNLYGQVSESYMDMTKEAYRIDTVGGGDWPFLLRAMVLPLDDSVFVERQSHSISRASALIGDKILERLKLIDMLY